MPFSLVRIIECINLARFNGNHMLYLKDSAGVAHLRKLSNAGLTHVHLLPTFQFAGVDDEKENWKSVGKHAF